MAASATNTFSSLTLWEAVPRMPIVSQVSTIDTPGEFIGTPNCSAVGPSAVCSTAPVMKMLADGAPLAKTFRPLTL